MGADAIPIYVGQRFTVESDDELEGIEKGIDDRVRRARRAKLQSYLGRITDGEQHFLLIGLEIGVIGLEDSSELTLSHDEVSRAFAETRRKLEEGGFSGDVALHAILNAQY